MNHSRNPLVLLLLVVVVLAGCDLSPRTPTRPAGPAELEQVSGQAKGGNGGGGSGGGTVYKTVTLSGGMSGGPENVPVQNDNKRELNVQGPMSGVVTSISASNCELWSGTEAPGQEVADLEALLNHGPINPFRFVMIYDKDGGISADHRLTLNWAQPSGNGNYIVNVTEDVTANWDGDSTYTFSGGYVRVTDKRGRKDSVMIRCNNLSTITVIAEDS